jgi:hypothetical protein
VVHVALCLCIVALLSYAAWSKLTAFEPTPSGWQSGPRALAELIAAQGILPAGLSNVAAWGVIACEAGLAATIVRASSRAIGLWLALVMIAAFSAYLCTLVLRDGYATCGCFGKVRRHDMLDIGMRNGAIASMILLALLFRRFDA